MMHTETKQERTFRLLKRVPIEEVIAIYDEIFDSCIDSLSDHADEFNYDVLFDNLMTHQLLHYGWTNKEVIWEGGL